jgi:hypothetical protein
LNWKHLKLGYWPHHPSFGHPGDRRRFAFYAKERNIKFETASLKQEYDIVYLTTGCDLTGWLKYKKKHPATRIIYEIIDSYIQEDFNLFGLLRGPVRFLTSKESGLHFNYIGMIRTMIRTADAVVCSTPAQKEVMLPWNSNIHISLDYFEDDIIERKNKYHVNGMIKAVWEGQAYTVSNLLSINNVLEKFGDQFELHVITDPVAKFPLKIFDKKTDSILRKLKCRWQFHQWDKSSISHIISSADLALIPIDKSDKLMWFKPENKLLLFWQTGIPVLTTGTPAYKRVMQQAGVSMTCDTSEDWVAQLTRFRQMDVNERTAIMQRAEHWLSKNHTRQSIGKNWDTIFESVMR